MTPNKLRLQIIWVSGNVSRLNSQETQINIVLTNTQC